MGYGLSTRAVHLCTQALQRKTSEARPPRSRMRTDPLRCGLRRNGGVFEPPRRIECHPHRQAEPRSRSSTARCAGSGSLRTRRHGRPREKLRGPGSNRFRVSSRRRYHWRRQRALADLRSGGKHSIVCRRLARDGLRQRRRGTPEHCACGPRRLITDPSPSLAAPRWCQAGRKEVIEILRQRSRPYLFSNTLPPVVAGATLAALGLLSSTTELRDRLEANTRLFREKMAAAGFDIRPGVHPIVPIMFTKFAPQDAPLAQKFARALLDDGIYVKGFFFRWCRRGLSRIRVQIPRGTDRAHREGGRRIHRADEHSGYSRAVTAIAKLLRRSSWPGWPLRRSWLESRHDGNQRGREPRPVGLLITRSGATKGGSRPRTSFMVDEDRANRDPGGSPSAETHIHVAPRPVPRCGAVGHTIRLPRPYSPSDSPPKAASSVRGDEMVKAGGCGQPRHPRVVVPVLRDSQDWKDKMRRMRRAYGDGLGSWRGSLIRPHGLTLGA